MPLRVASGAMAPSPPPTLEASARIDERSRSLAHLSGAALRNLSRARRQRLLAWALSEPRRSELGLGAPRPALAMYLTIEAPANRFIGGWPRIGVINPDGTALALLAGGPKTFTHIEAELELVPAELGLRSSAAQASQNRVGADRGARASGGRTSTGAGEQEREDDQAGALWLAHCGRTVARCRGELWRRGSRSLAVAVYGRALAEIVLGGLGFGERGDCG